MRTSTKEGSLQTTVKPSPWSDFMDLKKGNVYDISREEKVNEHSALIFSIFIGK